jgi:hypothetical protein
MYAACFTLKGLLRRLLMPRNGSRCLVWAFAACLGSWAFLGQVQEAAAILSYRGTWQTNENDDGRLIQSYSNFLNLNSSHNLIGRLTSDEHVNYNYRWEQGGDTQESISPGASLKLGGDIFFASLAVNSTKNLKTPTTQTDTLGFVWASTWEKRLIPVLRANYDYSRQKYDSDNSATDDSRRSMGTQLSWDLLVAQLFYSYRRNEGNFTAYQDTTDINLARVDATRAWLDDRLHVSVGHEYNKTNTERRIPFITGTSTNVLLALTGVDTGTDTAPNFTKDIVGYNPAPYLVTDPTNPLQLPAFSATTANNSNIIRLKTDGQRVDRIFLYTQTDLGSAPPGVTLRVYINDNFSFNPWTQVVGFAWSYDPIKQRFVLVLPGVQANYVKVVVDLNIPTTTVNFTEVQAEQVVHGALNSTVTTSSSDQIDTSNFAVDFRLNKKIAFFYNLLMQNQEKNSQFTNDTESHNAGVRMQNSSGDLKSTLSYSLARLRYEGSPEIQAESYGLSVNKVLLPTLTVALNGSFDDTSQAGAKVSTRNRYAFYTDARLYPDLNSQLEAVYLETTSYSSGMVSGGQDTLDTKFTLTSRFSPSLIVSFYDAYGIHNQTDQVSKKINTLGLSGNWQVSDLLSMYASVLRNSDSTLTNDDYVYSTGLLAGYGSGYELQVSYSLHDAQSKSQSGLASLRWTSNRNVSWEIGCNYAETEEGSVRNVYKFYSQVAVNFSTL